MIIVLSNLKLFGHHGVYEEEAVLGNFFICDVELEVDFGGGEVVDYEAVYEEIKRVFEKREALLENVAKHVGEGLLGRFEGIKKGWIKIRKVFLPIKGFEGEIAIRHDFCR